jgi:hypothetical protein
VRCALTGRWRVIELFGILMYLILLPYLGPSAARRELTRPVPKVQVGAGSERDADGHGGGDIYIRLTYRTARVLTAIA